MAFADGLLERLAEAENGLKEIWDEAQKAGNPDTYSDRIERWKDRWTSWISNNISDVEAKKFDALDAVGSVFVISRNYSPWERPRKNFERFKSYFAALRADIQSNPTEYKQKAKETVTQPSAIATSSRPSAKNGDAIFVVHGHDGAALAELKELLRDHLGLHPVVLSSAAAKGRTIIEKFEQEASKCSYAIVLMTPDDQVTIGENSHYQSRPNVIFELGWFYGKLGRHNVCILAKQGTDIHSDISGVNRIEFRDNVEEAFIKIQKELKSSGLL